MNSKSFTMRAVRAIACGLFLATAVSSAQAQDADPGRQYKWGIRVGVFYPTDGGLKTEATGGWFSGGIDYFPNFHSKVLGGDAYFSADVQWHEGGGRTNFAFPMLARVKWNISKQKSVQVYSSIGGGGYFINSKNSGGNLQPGVRFTLGAQVSERVYIEANYDYVSGYTDSVGTSIRQTGLSFQLGVKY